MADPTVLVSHTVDAGYWSDIEALRAAVETRVPGVDLRVAHTPPETRGLVGRAKPGAMKGDAVLVNLTRGEVVDEGAPVYAVQ